jgi:protein-tyrosine phosphatase
MTLSDQLKDLPVQISLEGAYNFRDLGGYHSDQYKRKIKSGLLFRSDQLSGLTESDQNTLRQLGIRTVIDLRREQERNKEPDQLNGLGIQDIWLPVNTEHADMTHLTNLLAEGKLNSTNAGEYLIAANRDFIVSLSSTFSQFLDLLLDPHNYPIVFHCSAGKDRAGFCAALVLLALGVESDVVMHDYLATNHCTAEHTRQVLNWIENDNKLNIHSDAIKVLLQVDSHYLQAALDEIGQAYNDINHYFDQALQFDLNNRQQLAQILLYNSNDMTDAKPNS